MYGITFCINLGRIDIYFPMSRHDSVGISWIFCSILSYIYVIYMSLTDLVKTITIICMISAGHLFG